MTNKYFCPCVSVFQKKNSFEFYKYFEISKKNLCVYTRWYKKKLILILQIFQNSSLYVFLYLCDF